MADPNIWAHIAENIKDQLRQAFRNRPFQTPQNRAPGRRVLANGTWLPAPTPRTVMSSDGASGMVHLWALVNPQGNILDRVIIKQTHPGRTNFNTIANWHWGQIGGKPKEAEMANLLYDELLLTGDEKHVVDCLGWGDVRGNPRWRYKLYLEFAEYGSLIDRIVAQRRHPAKKPGGQPYQKPFPEPFLWMLFEALAKAAAAMANGGQGGILHGDLQGDNVFFGAPDPGRFGMYPVPKVSDFGSTRQLGEPGVANRGPIKFNDPVCLVYAAPEQAKVNGAWEVPSMQFTERTNVWQIGMLMCAAMRLRPWLVEADWRSTPHGCPIHEQLRFSGNQGVRELPWHKLFHGRSRYSFQLIRLVQHCMRFNPNARPDANTLLNTVQQRMANRLNGADAAKAAGAPIPPHLARHRIHMAFNDKYRVGKPLRP